MSALLDALNRGDFIDEIAEEYDEIRVDYQESLQVSSCSYSPTPEQTHHTLVLVQALLAPSDDAACHRENQ